MFVHDPLSSSGYPMIIQIILVTDNLFFFCLVINTNKYTHTRINYVHTQCHILSTCRAKLPEPVESQYQDGVSHLLIKSKPLIKLIVNSSCLFLMKLAKSLYSVAMYNRVFSTYIGPRGGTFPPSNSQFMYIIKQPTSMIFYHNTKSMLQAHKS